MSTIIVNFTYFTGLKRQIFHNVRLFGSWDESGKYSDKWTFIPMEEAIADDGCPCFKATLKLDASQIDRQFHWGVKLDSLEGEDIWGISTEINDLNTTECHRSFNLKSENSQPQEEVYYLTHCRYLGAQKYYLPGQSLPGIQFAVWAPNAKTVEVVFGMPAIGYIADDGLGIDATMGEIPLFRQENGVWKTDITISPELADFSKFDHKPYMFKIFKEGGEVAYRTDLYSRCQIGKGHIDPNKTGEIPNSYLDVDGTKSCSVIIDPETVTKNFHEVVFSETEFVMEEEFWKDEFRDGKSIPRRVEDLIIYELHVGALGFGKDKPGTFEDAMNLVDYLVDLGVNAVELLPMSEFANEVNWGYETSHYFALEYSAGGRDQLKHFIRECHRHGIAVILDVVYNHYHPDAERAQWSYDSNSHENNIYYWYEGKVSDYLDPQEGYVDNFSTGSAPRFSEEMVRKLFISSAAALVEEFHIDGFRVDQTTSMHQYNVLRANKKPVVNANIFGAKFLRELTKTLKLIKPDVILIAEDHSNWDKVTQSPEQGGLGFDATWYADFYHHLIGDAQEGVNYAKLISTVGLGGDIPLAMDYFAGVMLDSANKKVVYHESHDEAGNSADETSKRTIVAAVNSAPLIGETRRYAEARSRFACGMAMLSAGIPMFFMGEEVGAQKPFTYKYFLQNREDLYGERQTTGQNLFKFYQDIIRLRLNHSALKSNSIEIIHIHNVNRVIAFLRQDENEQLLVVASLNNKPFNFGYDIDNSKLGEGFWKEIFNSEKQGYGGDNIGNWENVIPVMNGGVRVVIPANGFIVLQKKLRFTGS
jgi:1,4-alpha-glucan branching enzyme